MGAPFLRLQVEHNNLNLYEGTLILSHGIIKSLSSNHISGIHNAHDYEQQHQ